MTSLKSWDDAFGKPYGRRPHLRNIKKRRDDVVVVWMVVNALRTTYPKKYPLDDRTFSAVGKKLGMSAASTRAAYYKGKTLASTSEIFKQTVSRQPPSAKDLGQAAA